MLLLIQLDLNLAVWSLQKLLPPSMLVGHTLPLSRCLKKQERKKGKKKLSCANAVPCHMHPVYLRMLPWGTKNKMFAS